MTEPTADSELRLAGRLQSLRAARSLTLDGLAERSAVSRAMLSRIERGESSPTAQLLVRICGGLGITVAELFAEDAGREPVSRHAAQAVWRDPVSGYLRRTVSPAGRRSMLALAEITLPPGASVAFDAMGLAEAEQHVWLLDGALEVTAGDAVHRLEAGDCLVMSLEAPVRFANQTDKACRYAIVTSRSPSSR